MKYQFQISTGQFEYILQEGEFSTADEAVDAYKALQRSYKVGVGLPQKEWNASIEEYANTGTLKNGTELYAQMNEYQRFYFQEQKKLFARLKAKGEK